MRHFSTRTAWDLTENPYAAAVREARARGRKLYDLTVSNPTRCGLSYDAESLLAPLSDLRSINYQPDPCGMLSARDAIAQYYADHDATVDPAHLLLTASTSESYSFLFRLLCNPGDEVLVPQPSYPLFDYLAGLDDVQLRPYPLFYDHGWSIDLDRLAHAITSRTRAVLVVHPNNPTGNFTSFNERIALEELCVRYGLALVVDEVFLDYPLGNAAARSFAVGPHPALTFVLSGLSKVCALPQMKAAWLLAAGPSDLREEALARLELIADTFLSLSAPIQLALPTWLSARHTMQRQILNRVRDNLDTLARLARSHPDRLRLYPAEAGWAAVVALPVCTGEPACAERLVRERGVIVHPGAYYGLAQASQCVISLLGEGRDFGEAIELAVQ